MVQRTGLIPSSPTDVCPLMPGIPVPSITIPAMDGGEVNLAEAVRKKATVLVFYRGGW